VFKVDAFPVEITKLYPLRISRGISYGSTSVMVTVTDGQHTGIGESAPGGRYSTEVVLASRASVLAFADGCDLEALSITEIESAARAAGLISPTVGALEMACWDLLAKQAGLPLYRLFGLPKRSVATSVTVGINPPEETRERTRDVLSRTGAKFLKIKLGSPDGVEQDRAHFLAAKEAAAPFHVGLRVDANGGWDVATALAMAPWLAEHGVIYIEQPLVDGNEDGLPAVKAGSPLPIFVDESVKTAADIPALADRVDGVNLKLTKTGGIGEAMRLVAAARAHGLQTMIGCMGETSIGIAAAASIGALFDHLDLDSHLNLNPDPAVGLGWQDGHVVLPETPGHGAVLR
jgi:L-Ala-D/L-Glu epimerase